MKLIPLRRIDLTLGEALPWAVYDKNQNLLLRPGDVIRTRPQMESLLKKGLYRFPKSAQPDHADMVVMPQIDGIQDSNAANTYDFDDMELPIGSRLQLQSNTEQNPERHTAKYLGHIKGSSLMISTPVVDGKVLFLREGQSFIVRAFTGKTAFGFSASILRVYNAPIPYLHLSYPKQLHGVEIRGTKRLEVNIIATAEAYEPDNSPALPCLIINVSPNGALVAAENKLGNVGSAVKLAFRVRIGPIDGYISTKGTIRSITSVKDSAHELKYNIHHGMQFTELQQQDILLLHSLAYQKMCENGES